MKKFTEILKEIGATRAMIEESKANEKRIENKWLQKIDIFERHEAHKTFTEEWTKAQEKTNDLQLSIKLLKNNARLALFHEVLPVLVETLKKYNGKPYGEKTKEKFAKEIEEATGARVYLGTKYGSDEVRVYPNCGYGNDYAITIGLEYDAEKKENRRILIDNKIQALPSECFSVWYIKKEYFEDIPATIAEMKSQYKKAVEMQKALSSICNEFNRFAVDGIESIYSDKRIYDKLRA